MDPVAKPPKGTLATSVGRGIVVILAFILTWQTISSCAVFPPGERGFLYMIWGAGVILPLHEGGHFISSPFGYVLTIFGGSFWQVGFPVLLVIVALRQGSFWWTVYLTLTGVHMIDLTPYIFDAPFRSLPLITRNKHTHDWGNLLNHFQAQHHAETLADLAFYVGSILAISGTILSVILIINDLRPDLLPGKSARSLKRRPRMRARP